MSEIDRINHLLRPVMETKPMDRVQPGSDRHRREPEEQPHDSVELSGAEVEIVTEVQENEESVTGTEHGLDLSI